MPHDAAGARHELHAAPVQVEDRLPFEHVEARLERVNVLVDASKTAGHSPLMKPEAAVPRLTRAIVLADAVGARFVNTDEMVKPSGMLCMIVAAKMIEPSQFEIRKPDAMAMPSKNV